MDWSWLIPLIVTVVILFAWYHGIDRETITSTGPWMTPDKRRVATTEAALELTCSLIIALVAWLIWAVTWLVICGC